MTGDDAATAGEHDTASRRGLAADLRDPALYLTVAIAAAMGVVGALLTVAFVWVLRQIHEGLWQSLPDALGIEGENPPLLFLLAVCTTGGVLVGLGRHFLGEYPASLEQAVDDFRRTKAFDWRHLPQAMVISFASLGFGAALGPEAALVALVGGASSFVASRISTTADRATAVAYLGIAGGLGAVFGPGIAAVPVEEVAESEVGSDTGRVRRRAIWLVLPGLAAAAAGWFIFDRLDSGGGYFNFDFPEYSFAATDLAWAVLITAVGVAAAAVFLLAGRALDAAVARIAHLRILTSALGGIGLALLAGASSLMLFSGHDGIQPMIDDTGATAGYLLALAAGKVLATNVCLSTGWKGGRFFPLMFIGSAVGIGVSVLASGAELTPAVAVGMSAAVAAVLRKPIPALAFMLFVLPTETWPVVIVACLLGGFAGLRLFPEGDAADADEADAAPAVA